MLDDFKIHNLFWESPKRFDQEDPHLNSLKDLKFVYHQDWWRGIDLNQPGIFIVTGGRQIGKSTSLKLLIQEMLVHKRFHPQSIFYLPCDLIFDQQQLLKTIQFFLDNLPRPPTPFLLLLDEITFVPHWDRVIKALADEGWFRKGFCLITGSDSVILQDAAGSFPGRRGKADVVDFHLSPLSFRRYVELVETSALRNPEAGISRLFGLFSNYLECGGYLRAINDWHEDGSIRPATYATFEQWIRGDFKKRGKNEDNLLAVLKSVYEVGVTQNTYSGLTQRAGMVSKETFIDYCRLLKRMDILFTLEAFDQNTLMGFHKKAQKFHFCDPFIYKTVERWLENERLIKTHNDPGNEVEAAVAAQYRRRFPTYYIKAEGEIDLVVVSGKKFLPVEVKWTGQLRPNDLKQLKKYRQSVILTRQEESGLVDAVKTIPLPCFLLKYHSEESLAEIFRPVASDATKQPVV